MQKIIWQLNNSNSYSWL